MSIDIHIIGDDINDIILLKKILDVNFNINFVNVINENTYVFGLIKHAFTLLNNINKNDIHVEQILHKRKLNINKILNEYNKKKNMCIIIKFEDLITNYYALIKIISGKFNLRTKENYIFKSFVKRDLLFINTCELEKYKDFNVFSSSENNKIITPPELLNIKINEFINGNYLNLYNKYINLVLESKIKYFQPENFLPEVCFFHIEKCMGTSLREILFNYYKNIYKSLEIYDPENYNNINLITTDNLFTICSYNNNFKVILSHCSFNKKYVTDKFSKSCYSIICLREPIKRFISHYYFFCKKSTGKNIQELNNKEIQEQIIENTKNLYCYRLSGETGNINTALNNLKLINCILIQENIENDLIFLNQILNKKYNIDYKMKNLIKNTKRNEYDEQSDYNYLQYNFLDFFNHDYLIYNTILEMKIEDRIK